MERSESLCRAHAGAALIPTQNFLGPACLLERWSGIGPDITSMWVLVLAQLLQLHSSLLFTRSPLPRHSQLYTNRIKAV